MMRVSIAPGWFIASMGLIGLWSSSTAVAGVPGYLRQPALHGDTLVFASEGDLWTATIPTEDASNPIIAHRLTSSDGTEAHPSISPDGQRVAFAAEYDGNVDVYIMPVDGGVPVRLTFHPGVDIPLAWAPDSGSILFRSARTQPNGRPELWRIPVTGGMPERNPLGECSQAAPSTTGSRLTFTRWSNENWNWKGYRGGTAPDIWIGDLGADQYTRLTDNPANDMFPMWVQGRVAFLSDRDGQTNIYSDRAQGGDLKQHTFFQATPDDPTALEGYDVRWPSADMRRRSPRIVFCQAGRIALLDTSDNTITRLPIQLASDRVALRQRFVSPFDSLTEYALSPDGSELIVGGRGELLLIDVDAETTRRLTRSSNAREWGATFLGDEQIAMITDATGEQQIAIAPADASDLPSIATHDREDWLFPPATSADGTWIAFADRTARLHVLNMATLQRTLVVQSDGAEITNYRFSPDSRWLAYELPAHDDRTGGNSTIHLYALETQQLFDISDGRHNDFEPRWDPAGRYLYYLSDRHFDPLLGGHDREHIYVATTRIIAVPLQENMPPPIPSAAHTAGMDLKGWGDSSENSMNSDDFADEGDILIQPGDAADANDAPMRIDTESLTKRPFVLPIKPGNYTHLEAVWGGALYLEEPVAGLLNDDFGDVDGPDHHNTLFHTDLVNDEHHALVDEIADYCISRDRNTFAYQTETGVVIRSLDSSDDEGIELAMGEHRVDIDIRAEWRHIFDEAWRMQRDFYWAPNMGGVDWDAMKIKYSGLLDLVGTRAELNLVIGAMMGELGTSHTYIWGGEWHDRAEAVDVGLLGADFTPSPSGLAITRILPSFQWGDENLQSPLGQHYLDVAEGDVLLAVDGIEIGPRTNIHQLLQDRPNQPVRLTIANNAQGRNRRTIDVTPLASESTLRYIAWVDANRRYVEEKTQGAVGYIHIPDMGGEGLSLFSRQFFPQSRRKALIIDVRDNGGGFVSEMIIARLARSILAFDEPRQGLTGRYPMRAIHAHMVALIDEHAGSDGDIFPAVFRELGLGPLIGTRTWGGVVGIRADKPFVDLGLSTQPEFAWWQAKGGWTIENTGVEPDIEVEIRPEDRVQGVDPQLERGIAELLQMLADDPRDIPPIPPYPNK